MLLLLLPLPAGMSGRGTQKGWRAEEGVKSAVEEESKEEKTLPREEGEPIGCGALGRAPLVPPLEGEVVVVVPVEEEEEAEKVKMCSRGSGA